MFLCHALWYACLAFSNFLSSFRPKMQLRLGQNIASDSLALQRKRKSTRPSSALGYIALNLFFVVLTNFFFILHVEIIKWFRSYLFPHVCHGEFPIFEEGHHQSSWKLYSSSLQTLFFHHLDYFGSDPLKEDTMKFYAQKIVIFSKPSFLSTF